jgi:integrase
MAGLRRTKTGLWTARKEIPADIRAAYGKREEKRSWPSELSQGQAKAELAAWLVPIEERIVLLRSRASDLPITLSRRQRRALAGEWYREQVAKHEDDPRDADNWWLNRQEVEPDDPTDRAEGRIKPTDWLAEARDELIASRGITIPASTADALLQDMGDLWVSLCDLMERRAVGDYGPDPLDNTLPTFAQVVTPDTPKRPPAVSISGLFDDYAASGVASPATLKKWTPAVRSFVAFIGHDDATQVTALAVNDWVRSLIAKPLAVKTVRDGYVPAISVLMSDAVSRGLIPFNPVTGVRVRGPKATQLRSRSLSDDEAQVILSAALGPHPASLTERHARARRWVPWVCAYTGARVNEITQLRAMDVRQEGDVWVIHITPEAGSVKTRKARSVPLHSHLIDQGFHLLGKADDPTPLFYDPKGHRGGSDGNPQFKKVGERLALWVRSLGISGVQPNHGWRHRFKTVARAVRMDPEARDAIQGHAPQTEGQAYGDWPLDALRTEVEKLPRYA